MEKFTWELSWACLKTRFWKPVSLNWRNLQVAADNKEKAAQAQKAKAGAMKMALQTIGKFNIKKKVGQNNQIFGRYVFSRSKPSHLVRN